MRNHVVTLTRGWARVEVDGKPVVLEAPVRVERERWLVPEAFMRQVMPMLEARAPAPPAEPPKTAAAAPAAGPTESAKSPAQAPAGKTTTESSRPAAPTPAVTVMEPPRPVAPTTAGKTPEPVPAAEPTMRALRPEGRLPARW